VTDQDIHIILRTARPEDFQLAKSIIVESFFPKTWYRKICGFHGEFNGLDPIGLWDVRFSDAFRTSYCVLGDWQGETVGCALFTIHEQTRIGHLDLLAIRPERQKEGLGRKMLETICRYIKELGANSVMLVCDSKNDQANHLYEISGFRPVNQTIRWFKYL
jgi:ribosomal protein S18 acetylase RimI-like enzyme